VVHRDCGLPWPLSTYLDRARSLLHLRRRRRPVLRRRDDHHVSNVRSVAHDEREQGLEDEDRPMAND